MSMNDEPEAEPGHPEAEPASPAEPHDDAAAPGESEPHLGEGDTQTPTDEEAEHHEEGARPAFRRSVTDRYLGGVASGVGRALGVDAMIVRVGLAVATLFWSIVPAIYAALWLVVPEDGADRSLVGSVREPGGRRRVASVVALGIGATVLAAELGRPGAGTARLGLALVAVGLVLILGRPGARGWLSGPDLGPPVGEVGAQGPADPQGAAGLADAAGSRAPSPPSPRPAQPPPLLQWLSRGWLGWLCLSLVGLVAGATLALDGVGNVRPGWAVVVGLLIVAGGLLVGARRGRAHILIAVGLLLTPLWLGFVLSDIRRYDGEGRARHTPTEVADLREDYSHGYGELVLDLTELTLPDGEVQQLDLGLTAGEIEVIVPVDVSVDVSGEAGLGGARLEQRWEGRERSWVFDDDDRVLLGGRRFSFDSPARPPSCGDYPLPPDPPELPPDPPDRRLDDLSQARESHGPSPDEPDDGGEQPQDVDPDGRPCTPQSPPANPPGVEIDVRLGVGVLEVHHVETPA